MPAGEGRMAAQRDFIGGGAPAQLPIRFTGRIAHHKGGLGEQVLAPDLHQHIIGQPFIEHHHRRLIAAKGLRGEGIDVPVGDFLRHSAIPQG